MYNTFAPCPTVERAVRIGFRPGTVRAILLCGPAPIRHRRGRPLVRLDEFTAALTPRGEARNGGAHKSAPGVLQALPGPNRHLRRWAGAESP
ncbi:MAG: hypothetical protein JO116_16305 [Planctomycetaceae bacterium]|nr:hypothetical protein [Planctomycetaceae bacterium]